MTEKLYYKDQYIKFFQASVLSCEKREDGKYNVLLDKTAFFPEGGGQDADSGTIDEKEVEYVFESGENVFHITKEAIEVSKTVECKIDYNKRFRLMQIHSGEHIFCGVAHSLYGVENMGFHVGHDGVVVDFDKVLTHEQIANVEKIANEIIWQNRCISSSFPTHEEAKNIPFRSKKEITGQIRLITIDDCDICACCGIHVKSTGEVGVLKVISIAKKRNGSSVTMLIGQDAFFDYQKKHDELSRLSTMLALKPFEIADGVKKLKNDLAQARYELSQVKLNAFKEKAEEFKGEIAVVFEDNLTPDEIRKMCDILADKVLVGAVFGGNNETGYKYTLCSRTVDLRNLAKEFNLSCQGRGGGKPEMIQGNVSASREKIEEFLLNRKDF